MFRRGRGRPLLGAAVIVGASRSAARHEVAKQGQISAQQQQEFDRAVDKQRREEDERNRHTQLAIDEAIGKERARNAQSMQVQNVHDTGPTPAFNSKYCGECGCVRRREDKFCAKCGHRYQEEREEKELGLPEPSEGGELNLMK